MDKLTFFQQSLQLLGEREYARNTPAGDACDLWFPCVLTEALCRGAWSFATRTARLRPSGDHVFRLPPDCLRVLHVQAPLYRIEGRRLVLCEGVEPGAGDAARLGIRYISDFWAKVQELPDHEPLFVRGVSCLLSARMAPALTGNRQLTLDLEQLAGDTLAYALHQNALAQHSNDQHPLQRILTASITA